MRRNRPDGWQAAGGGCSRQTIKFDKKGAILQKDFSGARGNDIVIAVTRSVMRSLVPVTWQREEKLPGFAPRCA